MSTRLNETGYEHAQKLIKEGQAISDSRDHWSAHQPSPAATARYIEMHGLDEYGIWFLGIDSDDNQVEKPHYRLPYGDYDAVHRCALLVAQSWAGRYHHADIELAAAHLAGLLQATGRRRRSRVSSTSTDGGPRRA